MKGVTPHSGVEPCVGPKTTVRLYVYPVLGLTRVIYVVIELLALAKLARRFATPEGVHLHQIGKAKASGAPRTLRTDGPADASLESLRGLRKVVGTHEAPFALGGASCHVCHLNIHIHIIYCTRYGYR